MKLFRFFAALLLIAASLTGFVAAGVHSVRIEPSVEDVPRPVFSYRLAAEVAAAPESDPPPPPEGDAPPEAATTDNLVMPKPAWQ